MSEPQRASVQKGATNAHRLRGLFRYLLIDRTPIWKGASLQERPFENEGKKSKQKHAKQKKSPRGATRKQSGWATRIRTWIAGTKIQSPAVGRWPSAEAAADGSRRPRSFMVDREGFEPAALGLKVPCSTN